MTELCTRQRLALLMLTLCAALTAAPTIAQEAQEPAAAEQPVEVPVAEPAPGPDVTVRSQEALATLDRLRAELAAIGDAQALSGSVEELGSRVSDLLPEGQSLEEVAADPSRAGDVLVRARTLSSRAGGLIEDLTDDAEVLEGQLAEVRELIRSWQARQEQPEVLPEALAQRIADIISAGEELEQQASARLNEVIELQNSAMSVRNAITPIEERINSYGRSQQTRLFERNANPIWQISGAHLSESSQRSTRSMFGNLRSDFVTWTETSEAAIGTHVLLLPILLFVIYRLRRAAPEAKGAALARPLPAAVLIWLLIGLSLYVGAPASVRLIVVIIAMLVTGLLLLEYLPRSMRLGGLLFLVLALLERLFEELPITDALPRVAYFSMSVVGLVLVVLGMRREQLAEIQSWGAPRPLVVGTVWAGAALLSVSLVANLTGYVALAQLLLSGVVISVAVFLMLFAGLSSLSEIIEVILGLPVLDNVRSIALNRHRLNRVLRRPLVWISLLLWVWASARGFLIDGWLIGALSGLVNAEMTVGEVTLSLRGILVFLLAVWLAVWTSRVVRALLDQDVLPRMQLPRGVPNTISMTAHYSILMIGLLLGVGFMGIDLSNLAFIVGALGVGIGFGLQNVVNNFVSGLILIFEAPIQVGDTVEVGALMGTVVQIGIRTSRVRTFSGSEVIVPNGDLVSNQVINWTLSDRRRRLELTVGVAYGTDPTQVTEILRGVFDADPDVLDDPAPTIIFSAFGDSSLNFRMLVWLSDFDQGLSMTHRLNIAIDAALRDAGISIPFPQRDLHLKSLPDGAFGSAS